MKKKSNKFYLGIFGILIILAIIFFIISSYSKKLSGDEIESLVKTEISKYCDYLDIKATSSICETCRFGEYTLVEEFSQNSNLNSGGEYTLDEIEEGYSINVELNTIYGYNTRTGSEMFSFIIKEDGNVISPDYPENTCLS